MGYKVRRRRRKRKRIGAGREPGGRVCASGREVGRKRGMHVSAHADH
jgi:hypothetical protein